MNWVVSKTADRKEFQGAVQNGRLLKADVGRNKEVILDKKADWSWQSHFPSGDIRGRSGRWPNLC